MGLSSLLGGGSAPKAPNYKKLAKMDTEASKQAALAATKTGRPDQYGPGGSTTWTQDPTDPNKWTQKTNLDAAGQKQWDTSRGVATSALDDLAKQGAWDAPGLNNIYQGKDVGSYVGKSREYDTSGNPVYNANAGKMMADALYGKARTRAREDEQMQNSQFEARMAQQGIHAGSAAYDRAKQNMVRGQADAALLAGQNAALAGGAEARAEYQNALSGRENNRQEFGASLSGDQNRRNDWQSTLAGSQNARDDFQSYLGSQNQNFLQSKDVYSMPWERAGNAQGLVGGVSMPQLPGFNAGTGYTPQSMSNAANNSYAARVSANNAQQQFGGQMAQAGIMAASAFMA